MTRRLVGALSVTIFTLALEQYASALNPAQRTTYLTFSQAVGLPSVALHAGTYVFERVEPSGSPAMVRVLSRDRMTVYYTGFTNLVRRPAELRSDALVSMGESVAGVPPQIKVWWPMGENVGHEFIYR
jgi:hypothetical protein